MVLKVEINKNLEQKFRERAMKKYGYKRGALQKAAEDALSSWKDFRSDKISKVDDPFKLVEGILGHLKGKKTSVQLQHEAMDLWAKKYS